MAQGSERFHEILNGLGVLHDEKQKDYGTDEDPFANVRSTEAWGIPAWVGAILRLNDKVQRLKSMYKNGSVANESVEDSMRDIAVYAIIGLVLYEESLDLAVEEVLGNEKLGWPSQDEIDVDLNAVAKRLREMVSAEVFEFGAPNYFASFSDDAV